MAGAGAENVRDQLAAGLITAAVAGPRDVELVSIQEGCKSAARAIADAGSIAGHPPKTARVIWAIRAVTLARKGAIAAAAESAEALRKLAPDDPDSLLAVARAYALCLRSAQGTPAPTAAPVPDSATCRRRAIDAFKSARHLRPSIPENGLLDPDLNMLYREPDFRRLLTQYHAE